MRIISMRKLYKGNNRIDTLLLLNPNVKLKKNLHATLIYINHKIIDDITIKVLIFLKTMA
jgi:hypothetical protein